jgi:hypothetical protein
MKTKQVLSIEQMKHLHELGLDTSEASMHWQFLPTANAIINGTDELEEEPCLFISQPNMKHEYPAYTLQDITDEDCLKEGIEQLPYGGNLKPYAFYDNSIRIKSDSEGVSYGWYRSFDTPREAYASLIDKISGKGTWERNPYVFVYDFELVK